MSRWAESRKSYALDQHSCTSEQTLGAGSGSPTRLAITRRQGSAYHRVSRRQRAFAVEPAGSMADNMSVTDLRS